MKKFLFNLFFIIFCAVILILSLHGHPGNPKSSELNDEYWKDNGPLELSPDRGRFALTYSLLEDHSFFFSDDIARFATPDLGYFNGKYVSLFAPGVSYLIMPGYIIGKMFGASQIGTFAMISLFAFLNVLLIRAIAKLLGTNTIAATLGGLIFIFATPAFAYAVTLYQHHISTFLILLSVYLVIRYNNFLSLTIVWMLCAASIPIDYPNLFLMFPIGVFALGKILFVKTEQSKFTIQIKILHLFTFAGAILPLIFFMWFNKMSYGNPFQFSGTVPRIQNFDNIDKKSTADPADILQSTEDKTDLTKGKKSAIKFFNTRNLLNGFYIHFLSPDRGILTYTPVIFLGIIGIFFLYSTNPAALSMLLGIIGANVLLYSMWGDPYGGWAFASRYLIPTYSIMAIFIAMTLSKLGKNLIFLLLFVIIAGYSIAVNTLGAITTNRNPPQVEADALSKVSGRNEKFSYDRNYEFLINQNSKSFIWQTYADTKITAFNYYLAIVTIIILVNTVFSLLLILKKNK